MRLASWTTFTKFTMFTKLTRWTKLARWTKFTKPARWTNVHNAAPHLLQELVEQLLERLVRHRRARALLRQLLLELPEVLDQPLALALLHALVPHLAVQPQEARHRRPEPAADEPLPGHRRLLLLRRLHPRQRVQRLIELPAQALDGLAPAAGTGRALRDLALKPRSAGETLYRQSQKIPMPRPRLASPVNSGLALS